jgi:hypothetical protein
MTDPETFSSQARFEKRLRRIERKIDSVFDLVAGIVGAGLAVGAVSYVNMQHWQHPWDAVGGVAGMVIAIAIAFGIRAAHYPRPEPEEGPYP